MQIVVNHVTRMSAPRICVAGLDPLTLEHVRPTTRASERITRALLRSQGGPFGLGAIVELGEVVPAPTAPESEDHRFETDRARHIADMPDDDYLRLLDAVSGGGLETAFGPALERRGWKYAVESGCGERSLAVIRAEDRRRLAIDDTYGRLQLRCADVDPPAYIPVTDLRFYEPDQTTIRTRAVENVKRSLRRGVDAYLMLGLARAFRSEERRVGKECRSRWS